MNKSSLSKSGKSAWWTPALVACLAWGASVSLVPTVAHAAESDSSSNVSKDASRDAGSKSGQTRKGRLKTSEIENPVMEIDDLLNEVGRLEERFNKLQRDYGNPEQIFPLDEVRSQYEEATYLYLVEDYEKAALLFYAVLEKSSRSSFPDYEEAEYYLAESLSLGRNYYPALEYFTRIVEYGEAHQYYSLAVVNMVELYAKTGNFEKFEQYYKSYLERGGNLAPTSAILYALGKTSFAQQNYGRAQEIFSQLVTREGNYPHLSRYYLGATYVALKDYDKAIAEFNELLKLSVNTSEQREVEELAYMGLGRIYLEKGEYSKAQESYQNISRESRHFADALYEESWCYIKQENYEQAIRTIDILLLTFPDNIQGPKLKRIRGVLQQKRKDYEEALDTFQKLVAEYTGIKEELDRIMKEQRDILTYFNELVSSDLSRIESSFLVPALAVRFATADKDMARVLNVARDLKLQQRDLEESFRLLTDLEHEVYTNAPRNLLVGMRKVRGSLSTIQNLILLAKEHVVRSEQVYMLGMPDQAIKDRVAQLKKEQDAVGSLSKQLPEMQRDMTEMIEVHEDQVQEVQKNVYRLQKLVEDMLAEAAAIEKYITYSRETGAITPDVEQKSRFDLASERDQLDGDLKELEVVLRELREFDVRRMIKQTYGEEEVAFRREAESALNRSRQQLMALRSQAKADPGFTSKADDAYTRLDKLGASIVGFYDDLDAIEVKQVENVKKSLEREKEELNASGTVAQSYNEETNQLAEQIARQSFSRIHREFSDLILQADFGVTDVYWELKEEKTREIDQNQLQRAAEINTLQKRFSGLQSGDL